MNPFDNLDPFTEINKNDRYSIIMTKFTKLIHNKDKKFLIYVGELLNQRIQELNKIYNIING